MSIFVGIVGALGYTGAELIRIICNHPEFELKFATSRQEYGKKLMDIFGHLKDTKEGEIEIIHPDRCREIDVDLVFLAVPHKTAMNFAPIFLDKGIKVVDLSADFRFSDPNIYEEWYQTKHLHKNLLNKAVYGLIEIYKNEIKKAHLVANPGCYPTSIILGLYPALKNNLINPSPILIDSKSGTSGAGRAAKLGVIFSEVYDNFRPYNVAGGHRHTPEIEEQLSKIANTNIYVSFNPHLLPIQRGLISTIYVTLKNNISFDKLYKTYYEFSTKNRWIRLYPRDRLIETRFVRGTMYCDISLCFDQRTNTTIIISCIDNICRGASGQAVANANLMFGLEEDTGLRNLALIP